ncbi:hypothetical protein LTR59_005829 [Friedmanniomyces endolithicus]|nr:hypothetical protein LTR38_011722 [Friedmanniomyces endolithicus]KAK0800032.1 hypothetical protein LTR59_005829 [Friedmanniomyces endolithicus]
MSGMHSFAAWTAFALLASTIDARPQVHRHRRPHGQGTASADDLYTAVATPTATATNFPSLSIQPSHHSLSSTAPYGFTASGFAAAPTVTHSRGQPYANASSTASPIGQPNSPYPLNDTNSASATSSKYPAKFRGVNLGSWLVLESWMTPDVFQGTDAVNQWTFDSTDGAEARLQQHWSTYITEGDFQNMSSWGINAVRIPIGYWAYNNSGTPYITGADAYLETAIGWARQHGIWVMIDCHGSPGSQNGAEHSGHAGAVSWQSDDNLQLSIVVLQTIAAKYGAMQYADVVMGIELVNEPKIGSGANSLATTQAWAAQAYHAVRATAENKALYILHHDGFTGVQSWAAVGTELNSDSAPSDEDQGTFALDLHLYQNQDPADKSLSLDQHIAKACAYPTTDLLLPSNTSTATLPLFVGEFSAQISIPNTTDGIWTPDLLEGTRKVFEAQIDAFEHSSQGWFVWSLKQGGDTGAWSLEAIMENVYAREAITERKYPGICPFG